MFNVYYVHSFVLFIWTRSFSSISGRTLCVCVHTKCFNHIVIEIMGSTAKDAQFSFVSTVSIFPIDRTLAHSLNQSENSYKTRLLEKSFYARHIHTLTHIHTRTRLSFLEIYIKLIRRDVVAADSIKYKPK